MGPLTVIVQPVDGHRAVDASLKSTSPPEVASESASGKIIGAFRGLSIVPPTSV